MRTTVLLVLLVLLFVITEGKNDAFSPAQVQIYSKFPGDNGVENTLICHVRNFYPPKISIQLLKDGAELKEAKQSDLAFEDQWHFHLTKHVVFTPQEGQRYSCKVTHMDKPIVYTWDPTQQL